MGSSEPSLTSGESSLPSPLRSFEEVFDHIGHYGKYQLLMLILIQYSMINSAGNYIFISFASLRVECPSLTSKDPSIDACSLIEMCPANDSSSYFYGLYDDEEFVCPFVAIPQNLQTIQAIGSAIGALAGGHLADHFGRKWVLYSGAVEMVFFGLLGAVAPNWYVLSVGMFGMGIAYGVYVDVAMALCAETVGKRYRIVQTLGFQWSLSLQICAAIAYLTADWRAYLGVINAIGLPILFILPTWTESPRWLIQKQKYHEAADALNTISRRNGKDVTWTARDLEAIQLDEQKQKLYSFRDLFSTPTLRGYSIVMIFSSLTVEMSVAIMLFDVQVLAGNPFVNVALYGLLRIWVPAFLVFIERKSDSFGRRWMFLGSQGITLAAFVVTLAFGWWLPPAVKTCLLIFGGVVNSGILFTVYKQYTIELYPTVMRGVAVGSFGVIERLGGALAPQMVILSHSIWSGCSSLAATLIIGASLLTGALILPETRHSALPDTRIGDKGQP